jgi:penicillin-binding protein 2
MNPRILALGSDMLPATFRKVIRRPLPLILCACISAMPALAQDAPPRPVVVAYPNAKPAATRAGIIGSGAADAPTATPAVTEKTAPPPAPAPVQPDPGLQPSWETQKLARNYAFAIPAPRGQITDRNGVPLAQTRVAYNLAINFPVPPQFTDDEAARFIADQLRRAQEITGRVITFDPAKALKLYKDRGVMPLVIAQDLKPTEVDRIKRSQAPGLTTIPVYLRTYPQGSVAAHILGFVGKQGGFQTGPIENNELLWPEFEGRDGIEKAFNTQLTGKLGVMQISFDSKGQKAAEKITLPPRPGQNVVTSLDLKIQRVVERELRAVKRPCAMVVMDPNTGEILAMASEPTFDPNIYVPNVDAQVYDKLVKDPFNPLFPRAFRAAYPPGSIFKIVTGLAAMNDGYVDPDDAFGGEASIKIGGTTFRNWKKSDVGPLNFVEALTQSCNTYFYKMGLKCGHQPILDYASRLGLGAKTGIPIGSEETGNLMTTEYMLKHYNRRLMPGDIANMSIGQGDTLVTPVQMAAAMCSIASGGTVLQPRLVLQVQDLDGHITFGYDIRARDHIDIHRDTMKALRAGMNGVVNSGAGTAGRAGVSGFKVVGKTGTAQWGSGKKEKVAAWFVGYAPLEKPQYAFAVVYEGKPRDNDVHGGTYAAPIAGRVLKEILKVEPKEQKKSSAKKKRTEEDADAEMDTDVPRRRSRRADPEDGN